MNITVNGKEYILEYTFEAAECHECIDAAMDIFGGMMTARKMQCGEMVCTQCVPSMLALEGNTLRSRFLKLEKARNPPNDKSMMVILNKKLKKLEKRWSCNYKSWKDSSGEQSVKKSYLIIKWRAAQCGLQRNGLKEQIATVEKSEADMTAQYEAHQKVTDDLMDLKFALSDVERKENERNVTKKNSFIDELAQYENDITSCKRRMEICDQNIRDADGTISAYEKKRAEMHEKWIAEKEKVYSDTLAFDEKETVCPLCGQSYPADKIAQIKAEFEEKKVALKANWEKEHTDALERIVADGNRYKDLISRTQEKIVDLRTNQEKIKVNLQSAETERDRVIKLLKSLPDKVDCSANAEYQKLQEQITLKEEYLSKMNSGAEIRQQLKIKKNGLMDELAIVEKQIASADNSAKEERIEELEAEMREIAQSVADEEKMLYLLEKFMKAKMMILSKMVNEKFGIVNWKLFDKQVNGAVVECCECMVNGVPYSALNTGHRIVAGLDIIHALSVMHDVTAPIFVDNAEAVNDYNIPEMEGQLVLLQVTDDKELKVEREDMLND